MILRVSAKQLRQTDNEQKPKKKEKKTGGMKETDKKCMIHPPYPAQ